MGVHSLSHFTLGVPELDEAERFFSAFGLNVERALDRLHLRAGGSPHIWADIVSADRKRLLSIRFGIYQDDIQAFAERLAPVRIDAAIGRATNALWARMPDGLPIEVAVAPKASPDSKTGFDLPPRHCDFRGAGPRSSVATVRPRQLAHLALFTGSVPAAIEFYMRYLGMRISDRSGDDVAFLHGPHGSDHHMIALAKSDGPGLHHSSWDVGSIADVGQGAMQMRDAGFTEGWGVGRHVLGSNYFYYARDPWGSYAEYSADMDYIAADSRWVSSDSSPEDSFYQWGPPPPEDFGKNYEIV